MKTKNEWETQFSDAVQANDVDSVREAIENGVSVEMIIDDAHGSSGVWHAAFKGYYDVAKLLLENGAIPNTIAWGGATTISIARASGFPDIAELLHSYDAPAMNPKSVHSKAQIFAIDKAGNAVMDHPASWQQFDELVVRLNAIGDPFTKEDLLGGNARHIPWLEKAAMHGELSRVMEYLNEINQPLVLQDLLQPAEDGSVEATSLLAGIVRHGQVGALFHKSDWEDRTLSELGKLFGALPKEAQGEVKNYHALRVMLERNALSQRSLCAQ